MFLTQANVPKLRTHCTRMSTANNILTVDWIPLFRNCPDSFKIFYVAVISMLVSTLQTSEWWNDSTLALRQSLQNLIQVYRATRERYFLGAAEGRSKAGITRRAHDHKALTTYTGIKQQIKIFTRLFTEKYNFVGCCRCLENKKHE